MKAITSFLILKNLGFLFLFKSCIVTQRVKRKIIKITSFNDIYWKTMNNITNKGNKYSRLDVN